MTEEQKKYGEPVQVKHDDPAPRIKLLPERPEDEKLWLELQANLRNEHAGFDHETLCAFLSLVMSEILLLSARLIDLEQEVRDELV